MSDEIAEIKARLARLEAKEAVSSKFNEYLYYVDGENFDGVFTVFSPDIKLELMNFPPGSGQDMVLDGLDAVKPIYLSQEGIRHRHHTMNLTIKKHALILT